MADPINVSGTANTPIPVFKGDGYEHWSVRMRTILRSRELWDIVNLGVTDYGDNLERNRKEAKDDARAMVVIQQGVHDVLFSRIAAANTAQEAWDILRMEFQGDSQVQAVKLQGLRRDFENLMMKENEAIGDYFSRVMAVASQQRGFGEDVSDQKIVEKILRSLTERYDHVVPSIEVAYDLSQLSAVKLMGCLQSQEERLNSRSGDPKTGDTGRSDEQALQVYQPYRKQNNDGGARGRGRGGFRGRGRGRSQSDKNKVPQCYHCNRYGHIKRDCWFADEEPVNAVANNQEEEGANDEVAHLFMAITTSMTDEDDSMTSDETNDLNEAGHENNTIQVNDVPSTSQNHNAVAGPSNTNEVITDSSSPPYKEMKEVKGDEYQKQLISDTPVDNEAKAMQSEEKHGYMPQPYVILDTGF
ncbi:hypothetical protein E3N88_03608 [Mikania micrantha]|uniref:CCHC-type domain-containing protein n=1 Tax=Mikania micrantha TaxID=192012 RepID=A0A5N6Q767_9ASTR|nr:hypothetical protein E3N88_03608 [Mikania micrantha]